MQSLLLGAAAGIVAQTACYPLDTIRRRMQMKGRCRPRLRAPPLRAAAR